MILYKLLKPILFKFDAEKVHDITKKLLEKFHLLFRKKTIFYKEIKLFGTKMINPVGLAAGFDKNGTIFHTLPHFGFGFAEMEIINL